MLIISQLYLTSGIYMDYPTARKIAKTMWKLGISKENIYDKNALAILLRSDLREMFDNKTLEQFFTICKSLYEKYKLRLF